MAAVETKRWLRCYRWSKSWHVRSSFDGTEWPPSREIQWGLFGQDVNKFLCEFFTAVSNNCPTEVTCTAPSPQHVVDCGTAAMSAFSPCISISTTMFWTLLLFKVDEPSSVAFGVDSSCRSFSGRLTAFWVPSESRLPSLFCWANCDSSYTSTMSYSPGFLKFRAAAFRWFIFSANDWYSVLRISAVCIIIISIVWVVLLCFELFWRWDISAKSAREFQTPYPFLPND